MRKSLLAAFLLMVGLAGALAAEPAPPSFTAKPAATRAGDKVKIEFAVSRETDVAVFIEDGKGKVIRHLVAGVLGPNAPAPLKPGLAQSIEWDGKADYGKPAGAGPFKVRVALGLGARFDSILAEDRQCFGGVKSLAVGPDGTLYLCCSFGAAVPNWPSERIVAVGRDGQYLRTVLPWPVNLKKDEIAAYGIHELDGRVLPLIKSIPQRRFHSGNSPRKAGMALTPDGVILKINENHTISAIGARGNLPWGAEAGPRLNQLQRPRMHRPYICVSSDGRRAFLSGLGDFQPGKKPEHIPYACVFAVKLPERSPADRFFGKPEEAGKDETHLSDTPRGLAVDGKGHLLVADHRNDRVVVIAEADAKFVGEFPVQKPDGVAVDPASGAVYVSRLAGNGNIELIKFSGWKQPKELAKLPVANDGDPQSFWTFALDAGAKPPVIWLGGDYGKLIRVEDLGDKFAAKDINTAKFGNSAFVDLTMDRFRPDREVYVRCGQGNWFRFNEDSGQFARLRLDLPSAAGSCLTAGPDGNLYVPAYAYHLLRFTRDGKPNPWPEGNLGYPAEFLGKDGKTGKIAPGPKHGIFVPVSMIFMTHTLGIRHDGHLFMFEPGHPGDRPPKMLREYTPDGRRVSETPIIWKVSDTAIGPKFDPQGNIYVAEQIKPLDQPHPPEFAAVVGKIEPGKTYLEKEPVKDAICTMYGSIVKFGPRGGTIHFGGENPFKGEPKLDPALKTVEAGSYHGYRLHPTKVTGAEWIRMGISHVDLFYCNCENTRFDVDEFGRVWYPDLGRFRVGVLDTNGNEVTHFGGYGNAESCGPESRDKALAEPEIAFSWLVGVGATDRYAYMGDSMNRRLLRAKLVYAAEETCEVK